MLIPATARRAASDPLGSELASPAGDKFFELVCVDRLAGFD